jgi:hypothetical protein
MIRFALLLGFALFPVASLVALLGPLRGKAPGRTAGRFYGALAILGLGVAAIAAAGEATHPWRLFGALAALLIGPSTGLFVALRTEGVRADPRMGWVLGPLGYLAGCALGIQALVRFGFGV